ncbi:MAG: pteridine reductase [Gammaproteobacteria bacterium]|nr:pteridine reductase [Gammaproteobacteria bacterium]MDD9897283.1 pteridine reductase [Gammaproteobacteria bacterium]MDD9959471.1 pteridine reductase [Gammaproteobacteria bacterium]
MPETKVALITGSAKRIGAAIASMFHEHGFNVIVHANKSIAEANELVADLNSARANSAVVVFANLNNLAAIETLAAEALDAYGRLDVLVNNASAFYPSKFADATQSQWDDLFNSNVRAAYFLSQQVAPDLSQHNGTIINIVDTHADKPLADHSIYNMAKAALKTMTKSLAKDLGPAIRVNGVSPGAILWPTQLENEADPAVMENRKKILESIALNRLGSSEDIANMTYFLATDASYITGQVIKVDGGRSLS